MHSSRLQFPAHKRDAMCPGTQGDGAGLVGPRVSSLGTSFLVRSSSFALLYLWCQIPHTPPPQRRDLKHSSRLQFPAHKREAMCPGTQGDGAGLVGPRVSSLGTSFLVLIRPAILVVPDLTHTPPPQRRDLKHSSRLQFPAHKHEAMCSGTQGDGAGLVGPRVSSLGTSFLVLIRPAILVVPDLTHTPPPQRRDLKHSSRLQFPAHKREAMCSGMQGNSRRAELQIHDGGFHHLSLALSSFRGIRPPPQCPPCMSVSRRRLPGWPSSIIISHCSYLFSLCPRQRIHPAVRMMQRVAISFIKNLTDCHTSGNRTGCNRFTRRCSDH